MSAGTQAIGGGVSAVTNGLEGPGKAFFMKIARLADTLPSRQHYSNSLSSILISEAKQ